MDQIDLSIVIPVYRPETIIRPFVERLIRVFDQDGRRYEIILVDDGGPDASWDVLSALQSDYPGLIVAVQLMRNFGRHNALMCGFRHARGHRVVTMDDDLRHPPEAVPTLLEALEGRGLDLVYGGDDTRRGLSGRRIGSALVNRIYRTIFRQAIRVTSFRAIRGDLLGSVLGYHLNTTCVDGVLAWNTRRIGEVTVVHHPPAAGRSGSSFGKRLLLALNLLTNFSQLPLSLVSPCGVLVAGGGLVMASYYSVESFRSDDSVPGYASIIITILVLGGIQLLSLGIIGEYLGRLHLNVNCKPQYVERQVLGPTPRASEGPPSPRATATRPRGDGQPPWASPPLLGLGTPAESTSSLRELASQEHVGDG